MPKISKSQQVKDYLLNGNSITSYKAFYKFGVTRVSSIIFNLRKAGYNIESTMVTSKNEEGYPSRYAVYKIVDAEVN